MERVASEVDLRLLGPVEVHDNSGQAIRLAGTRLRALLALLALRSPNMVTTDTMLDAIWGSEESTRPEAALHMAISRLRAIVGEELIVTVSGGYRLNVPTPNTDLNRFRALVRRGRQLLTLGHPTAAAESFRHALAYWRGPPLADLDEFAFAEQAARGLEEERVSVVELLMEAALEAGEHELAVGELFGLVESFPYREGLWKLLMLALYRSGRQTEALAAFKELRSKLGDELGLEPSDELVDLEARILLHDPALATFDPTPSDLIENMEYLSFSPGDTIVEQGQKATSVYWVEEGTVEIIKTTDDGRSYRIAELGPGRYFGELASALGTRRTATVRALVPTTVSVHDLSSFRARLGIQRVETNERTRTITELWQLIGSGEYLRAFDLAVEASKRDPSVEIRYLAVLALARSGARVQARRRYEQYGLANVDPSTLSPRLGRDMLVLAARLDKDEALARRDLPDGPEWARMAAEGYSRAFERSRSAYHAVNAATMWLLAGQPGAADHMATRALSGSQIQGHDYWDAVTEAEAALILGDVSRGQAALEAAGASTDATPARRATTLKQLSLICHLKDIDPSLLHRIKNRAVVHYCGHRILPSGATGRFPASEQARVRSDIRAALDRVDAGSGFGSLAAGADILVAEELLRRGAELHVRLPFAEEDFVRASVIPAGGDWIGRFEACLASASSVEITSSGEYLDDPVMFDFCSRIAMGDALLRAEVLAADAHQVAVWDGMNTSEVAGTAVDVRTWTSTGYPTEVIPVEPGESQPEAETSKIRRRVRALVFADFAGFSQLTDAQMVVFQDRVMATLSHRIEHFRPQLLAGRTWGDGIYLVFTDVLQAADCALELVDAIDEMDMPEVGLPQLRGLRVAAHAAPLFEGWDPISGSYLFYGSGVTHAARIEPRTPEGEIYTTREFAALAMLSGERTFDCQYVGTLPTAKQFGEIPLYALRIKADAARARRRDSLLRKDR